MATILQPYPDEVLMGTFAVAGGMVWLTASGNIVTIDPATNKTAMLLETPGSALFATAESVWQTTPRLAIVTRYDLDSLEADLVIDRIAMPEGVDGDETAIWVADHHAGSVLRLDPESGVTVAIVEVGPAGESGPMYPRLTPSGLWVTVPNLDSVVRIDPATNRVTATIGVPQTAVACGGTVETADAVWASTCFDGTAAIQIDPHTNEVVRAVELGGPNGHPALIDAAAWFPVGDTIVRVSSRTGRVDRILRFADGGFEGVSAIEAFDSVWISSLDGRVARLSIAEFKQ